MKEVIHNRIMKRKQYLDWLSGTFGLFATVYGLYLVIWHYNRGDGMNALALILLILGAVSLLFFIALMVSRYIFYKKRKRDEPATPKEEETKPEATKSEEPKQEQEEPEEDPMAREEPVLEPRQERVEYVQSRPRPSRDYSTVYVRLLGYGPVLRIEGPRILDMRSNTYYRIQGNMVYQEGSGPCYEISGDRIRSAFGGYLFELSGSNINKVFGGFYASISGNLIKLYDLSREYELSSPLSKDQILVLAVLLFEK